MAMPCATAKPRTENVMDGPPRLSLRVLRCPPRGLISLEAARREIAKQYVSSLAFSKLVGNQCQDGSAGFRLLSAIGFKLNG
jgi:hypothetical protein